MTDRLANHYFDADILLNFFRIHQEKIIIGLINNRFITEQVYKEFLSLCKYRMGAEVGNRLTFLVEDGRYKLVNKNNFSISEYLYYQSLLDPQIGRKAIGKGEASIITMVKFRKGIIVSSNFADVADYAQQLGLAHIGTIDILKMAFQKGLITSEQALRIHSMMIKIGAKLPPLIL